MPGDEGPPQRMETRLSKIESLLKDLKEQLGGIARKIYKIEGKLTEQENILDKLDEFLEEIEKLNEQNKTMKAENIKLKMRLNDLETELDKRAKKEERNTLEIFGLPKLQTETPLKVVLKIAEASKMEITENAVESCYRLASYQGRERPLVVKFKRAEIRDKLMKEAKKEKLRLININMQPENKKNLRK